MKRIGISIACIWALIITSCSSGPGNLAEETTLPPTMTVPIPNSEAPSTPQPPTQTPTATPTIVEPSYTPSPTPTAAPTLTPVPTLAWQDAKTLLLDLVKTNGDCQFPCILGKMPGKTIVDELKNWEFQFGHYAIPNDFSSSLLVNNDNSSSSLMLQVIQGRQEVWYSFEHRGSPEIESLQLVINKSHSLGDTNFLDPQYYKMSSVLLEYGQPSQIFLGPWPSEPDRPHWWTPFGILFYYPEQGFLIEYVLEKQENAESFIGCPDHLVAVDLVTWDPKYAKSIEEVVEQKSYFWGVGSSETLQTYYLPVTEALNMTVGEFYDTYKKQGNLDCIIVPNDIWPYGLNIP